MKYVNEQWVTLNTKIVGEDENYVYYMAETPSFSIYAIGTKKIETTTPTTIITTPLTTTLTAGTTVTTQTTPTTSTPGFEVIAGLLTLGLSLALKLRRK